MTDKKAEKEEILEQIADGTYVDRDDVREAAMNEKMTKENESSSRKPVTLDDEDND